MNEPITIRVRNARSNVKPPEGMEISMNADGSGGSVPEKNPAPAKKIGPQGLGEKGNNGYSIGSPAAFKAHKMYGKDGAVKNAKTKKEHLSLKKEGYGHTSPVKKKDACYAKVASRYKGGNSAYRSGAMVKCRKVGAANWGNKSK
tara:strand:+ start:186 stop:620 length:435 start_codon:yes stop_codon:yes gene_type:complete